MKPSKTNHQQERLFEHRLSDILNPNHSLLLFASLIQWEELDKEFSGFFTSEKGAPAKPVRLMTGIFMLQHMSGLSDAETVKIWCENPYWQAFCGYDFLQWQFPVHPSSLSRWRKKLGTKGLRRILQETVRCAVDEEIITTAELKQVIVDTTVMQKNISFPTDAKLYYKSLRALLHIVRKWNIPLRQSYKFVSKKALRISAQSAHARRMRAARKAVKALRNYLGRVLREVESFAKRNKDLKMTLQGILDTIRKVYIQERGDSNKIYSMHEPHVECIAKGKAHKKYEFGCKVSVVTTHKSNFVLSCEALHGNPFDGHTLKKALKSAEKSSGKSVSRAFVDKGYKGHKIKDIEIYMSGKRGLSKHFKSLLNRRQAIEPVIGHMKNDGKLGCNFLKGKLGDCLNALLCGIGHNVRIILRKLVPIPA